MRSRSGLASAPLVEAQAAEMTATIVSMHCVSSITYFF